MTSDLPKTIKKTIARLAAIQALYAHKISDDRLRINNIIVDFLNSYENHDAILIEEELIQPDSKFFAELTKLTITHEYEIDEIIARYLTGDWKIESLSIVMQAILKVSICELKYFPKTPYKVIINEYTTIARDFYSNLETGFINGVLEKINIEVRDSAN